MTLDASQRRLVEDFEQQARRIIVAVWRRKGGDLSDMLGLGLLGLCEAASRFDPAKGDFGPYAAKRIRGSIMDEARRVDHVPKSVRVRYNNGDTTVTAQVEARPVLIDDDIAARLTSDKLTDEEAIDANVPRSATVFIRSLPSDQQAVLALRYFAGLEIREIAGYFGVPESRTSKIHAKAVMAVRDFLAKQV